MTEAIPTEHQEQVAVFQWAALHTGRWPELKDMFAIPNGGARSAVTGAMLRAEGVKKGVPDIFLPCPVGSSGGLFVEMKRRKGSRLSKEQLAYIKNLRSRDYAVAVCHGAEEAILAIMNYMELRA